MLINIKLILQEFPDKDIASLDNERFFESWIEDINFTLGIAGELDDEDKEMVSLTMTNYD